MTTSESALLFKENGNKYYKVRDFEKAIECYQAAISEKPDCATLYGNLSAAYYESGDYSNAAVNCLKGLKLTDFKSALGEKLINRLVLVACLTRDVSILSDLTLSQDQQKLVDSYSNKSNDELDDFSKVLFKQKPLLCKSYEYYCVGHDSATSALDGSYDDNGKLKRGTKIDLGSLDEFCCIFGGVGDGRHPLTTMIDISNRVKGNNNKHFKGAKFIFNDINATVLARLILVFLDLERFKQFDSFDCNNNSNLDQLVVSATSKYLGCFLHPKIYESVMNDIRSCAKDENYWQQQLPYMKCMDESTRSKIARVFNNWADRMDDISLDQIYDVYDAVRMKFDTVIQDKDVRAKIDSCLADKSEQLKQFIDSLSEEKMSMVDFPPGMSMEEKKKHLYSEMISDVNVSTDVLHETIPEYSILKMQA